MKTSCSEKIVSDPVSPEEFHVVLFIGILRIIIIKLFRTRVHDDTLGKYGDIHSKFKRYLP